MDSKQRNQQQSGLSQPPTKTQHTYQTKGTQYTHQAQEPPTHTLCAYQAQEPTTER